MLQAIIVRVKDFVLTLAGGGDGGFEPIGGGGGEKADEIVIGIYGPEAGRASGHNEGRPGHLPKRKFIGASEDDKRAMIQDISSRVMFRLRQRMKGK
jgi:hypothetical protein